MVNNSQSRPDKIADPHFLFLGFEYLCRHYAHLSNKIEDFLLSEKRDLEAEVERLGRRRSILIRQSIFAHTSLYPGTVRHSLFIALYQQFEFTINQVCVELEKDFPNNIKVSDLKDRGISRSHTYLQKVVGISDPFELGAWNKIKDLNDLRNLSVHNDGRIRESQISKDTKTVERINEWAQVTIHESSILLSDGFVGKSCMFLLEQVYDFCDKLDAAGWRRDL